MWQDDGSSPSYTNWQWASYADVNAKFCGEMFGMHGLWEIKDCNKSNWILCEIN